MAFNSLVQNPTETTFYDPLEALEGLKEPSCVRPEQSPYLLKLLLARLPQNRKMELSLHLYPKALDLMDQHNLWGMLKPFVPLWFKYRNSVLKDPLLTPYEIYNPMQNFSFLKLLLARLPICDRARVASPLLVLAIGFMHQNRLWYELSPFNSTWSTLKSSTSMELKSIQSSELQFHGSSRNAQQYNRSISQERDRGRVYWINDGGRGFRQTPCPPNPDGSYPIDITQYTKKEMMRMLSESSKRLCGEMSDQIENETKKSTLSAPTIEMSPAKDDFTGVDWCAPLPSTVPEASAPSTSSPPSQQSNQHYNSDNSQFSTATATFTSVAAADGPMTLIDWSAPLPVESSAEVSVNLRPSADVEDVDPFSLHKIFCLLCASSEHSMVNCPETPPAKMVRICDLKLCEKCLSPGHHSSDCTELVVCITCGLDHLDYIHHKPTDWMLKQASISYEQLQIGSRQRRISQVSNVSTHFDMTDNDVQPPKQSCNSSCAHLEDLLFSTNCSDMAIPIEPTDAQHFLMTFHEL